MEGKKVWRKIETKQTFSFKQTSHRFSWHPVFHPAACPHICQRVLKNKKTSSQVISQWLIWSPSGDSHRFILYPQTNFLLIQKTALFIPLNQNKYLFASVEIQRPILLHWVSSPVLTRVLQYFPQMGRSRHFLTNAFSTHVLVWNISHVIKCVWNVWTNMGYKQRKEIETRNSSPTLDV